KAAETQGTGALVLDGKMVDTPVIKSAQLIVETAERLDLD
ncbi:MAG: CoA ester lyase, partial [Proteobacteria bacterium]|nr:CoA ester lyase [Pseudomonadota bacterium]